MVKNDEYKMSVYESFRRILITWYWLPNHFVMEAKFDELINEVKA